MGGLKEKKKKRHDVIIISKNRIIIKIKKAEKTYFSSSYFSLSQRLEELNLGKDALGCPRKVGGFEVDTIKMQFIKS